MGRNGTVLVLGIGLQGRAVVHDLAARSEGLAVVAADLDAGAGRRALASLAPGVPVHEVDAADGEALAALLRRVEPAVVVCMLPPELGPAVARVAIEAGVHYVSTSYTGDLAALDGPAREAGVTVLPEMGMDPGIDLLLCRLACDGLDEVLSLESFGGGIPEPACAWETPLGYKVTWRLDGVLAAYRRPARFLRGGAVVDLPGDAIFAEGELGRERFEGLGELEAYPNGDALRYVELFGLGPGLETMTRSALRWPGHGQIWRTLGRLGLLDEQPVAVDGTEVVPRRLLARLLEPRLAYRDDQADLVVLRARARGLVGGERAEVEIDLRDRRDGATGLFAMNRTVGFTAAVAARLVASGEIARRGVLAPARDVPVGPVLDALVARGMRLERRGSPPRRPVRCSTQR